MIKSKLCLVEYGINNGEMFALETYEDGTKREVRLIDGIVNYILEGSHKKGCGKLFEQEDDVGLTKCGNSVLCPECVNEGKAE